MICNLHDAYIIKKEVILLTEYRFACLFDRCLLLFCVVTFNAVNFMT